MGFVETAAGLIVPDGELWRPGDAPDTFDERLRGAGVVDGDVGQFVNHDLGLTTIANPRDVTLYGPGLDMLWVAGDGNRPTIWNGAPLAPADPDPLAVVGAPVAEVAPYQLEGGADVALESHTGASGRHSGVPRDPAAGEDIVVIALSRMPYNATPGGSFIFATYGTGAPQGVILYHQTAAALSFVVVTAGGAGTANGPGGLIAQSGLCLGIGVLDRTADTVSMWSPGAAGVTVPIIDGAITGGGIGIAKYPDFAGGFMSPNGGVILIAYLMRAGIAPDWTAGAFARCVELTRRLTGIEPGYGAAPAFTRATARSRYDRNGRIWLYSCCMAGAGDSERLIVEPTRVNHCYRNIGIPLGALAEQIGDDASTATGVADVAALAAAGLADWGPNVASYANATGATRYIRNGAATGAVTRFALSVHGDIIAGAGPRLGWWDTAGPGWTDVGAAPDNYARATYPDLVPPAATCVACLAIPNGCTYYWIAEQCEGSGSLTECTVTTPVPSFAAAAGAQRNADDLTTVVAPPSGGGSVELVAEPRGWGGGGNTVAILYNTGSGNAVLWADATTGTWECLIDGTTTLNSGVAPVDGAAHHIRLRWVTGVGMSIEVRAAATMALLGRADGAYDGSLMGAGGTWQLAGGPVSVSGLRCYRNGGG